MRGSNAGLAAGTVSIAPVAATRYGTSPWIDHAPRSKTPVFPVFRGTRDSAVVIVGGGLTGVMTAHACAVAGLKVVLLEADRIGRGGSGHGNGICAAEASSSFKEMERLSGRRVARVHFQQTRKAVRELAAAVRRLRIKAEFDDCDACRLAVPQGSAAGLQAEARARRDANLDATWQSRTQALRWTAVDAEGAVRVPGWAVCDPYRLTLGFAAAAVKRGVEIFERSPVTKVTFTRTDARVVTPHGSITASTVVHCTGEPGPLAPALRRHVKPMRRGLVMTAALPAAMRKAIGPPEALVTDAHAPPHVVRFTDDPAVLVAGADIPRARKPEADRVVVARTNELMYELSLLYPVLSGIPPAHGWSLEFGATPDGGVLVGPHRNYPHQLFAFGTLHDPARAWLASRVLTRHLNGEAVADDERLGFARCL